MVGCCTCGSDSVIDERKHAANCTRRLLVELADSYDERIAHLRTGLELAEDDINSLRSRLIPGIEPIQSIQTLLGEDIERSIRQDKLR